MRNLTEKPDWTILLTVNGMRCDNCGMEENPYVDGICFVSTTGLTERYGHPEFELVLQQQVNTMGYILNELGFRVRAGEKFEAGQLVSGIFADCDIRLDKSPDHENMLRVIIPDNNNRWPEEDDCASIVKLQTLSLSLLERPSYRSISS